MSVYNLYRSVRRIHSGHVKKVLNSARAPFHGRFDKISANQAERGDFASISVKYEKDTLVRDLAKAKKELVDLFSLSEAKSMVESRPENGRSNLTRVNEARRIYRMLRPEAPSFFEEQASTHFKGKLEEFLSEKSEGSKEVAPSGENLVLDSLVADVRAFCEYLEIEGLPERSSDSFGELFERLEKFFGLKADGSTVKEWVGRVWPKFRGLMVDVLASVETEDLELWLEGHLERVATNLALLEKPRGEWYFMLTNLQLGFERINFSAAPTPLPLDIEDNYFPVERAGEYLAFLFSLFKDLDVECVDDLVKSLNRLGLSNWFKIGRDEIESWLIGVRGQVVAFDWAEDDPNLSCLLIETVARNLDHLLDIRAYSPGSILSVASKDLERIVFENSKNCWLAPDYISEMVGDIFSKRLKKEELKEIVDSPLKQMILSEDDYSNKIGSVVMKTEKEGGEDGGWKWVLPSVDSIFDANRNMYIRNKSNLDPLMRLDNLKSFILSRSRMRSMTKEGRVYFIRVIVAIGDGNGYFGFGIGYGNDVNSAKNSGIENALKNMFFLDYDPLEPLTTPVLGQEYGSRCIIKSRPVSSGIHCNKKFLPLLYLIGLNDIKFKLKGTNSWVTRIRSIRKSLESILSRRTIANMLGKRFVAVSSPGDHTIHWPDEWFNPILREYHNKINRLKRLRFRFSRRNRMKYNFLLPADVGKFVPNYNHTIPFKKNSIKNSSESFKKW